MEALPQEWTEGRLNELSIKVDKGFDRVDADIRDFRLEVKGEFAAVRAEAKTEFVALRGAIKAMDGKLTERLDSVQRTMIQMMVALTAAILAGFAGICTLIAATL